MTQSDKTLKHKTISGAMWKFSERVLTQFAAFVVSIILARMLLPEDYGIIVLVSVFVAICDKIIICGFATSLIQKKNADDLDFSSVLYFSMAMALLLYAILYITAPFISSFYSHYDGVLLTKVMRVMGLSFFIIAINSVQHAYVSSRLRFKNYFWSVSVGTLIGAVVAIYMAYKGFGVWSLVAQNLVMNTADTVILWFSVKWRPIPAFSFERFRSLFSYSWKICSASIIKTVYNDLRSLIIGKLYSPADLAFYNRGQSFPQMVDTSVSGTIDSVFFPALSKVQDSTTTMKSMLRRAIRVSSMILMPLVAGLAATAEPLVNLLLTEKWASCVPYMQILSFSFLFSSIEVENLQAIKAIGRSDLVLKLEIIKKSVGLAILVATIPFGVKAIAYGVLASQLFSAIANMVPNKKLLDYSIKSQIVDVSLYLTGALFMFLLVMIVSGLWTLPPVWDLLLRLGLGAAMYAILLMMVKDDSLKYVVITLKEYKRNA